MHDKRRWLILALVLLAGLGGLGSGGPTAAQAADRFFPETSHVVRGRFLQYWTDHGGLAQQGYPISDEFPEVSLADGKTYLVQYFERAVFEYHPEYAGSPYEVLLSLVGVDAYRAKYPQGAPDQRPHPAGQLFPQTGKRLGGSFQQYWQSHGGLAQQGYPISDEFTEISALDQQPYTVQYFERAVFEYHPENKGTPYEVLLAQLGTYRQRTRYQGLPLPPPRAPTADQREILGNDRYLVWSEKPPGVFVDGVLLRGFDMQTRQPLTITTQPAEARLRGLSGSLIVWEAGTVNCDSLPCVVTDTDIVGQDLTTGQPFTVAAGTNQQYAPAIAGRTVVWLETTGVGQQVLARDLDSTLITPLATATNGSGASFAAPAISDEYIVWVWSRVPEFGVTRTARIQIQAYNRATRDLQTVAEYDQRLGEPTQYALDGHQLVWLTDSGLQLADLNSSAQRTLASPPLFAAPPLEGALHLHGDLVFWLNGPNIDGLRMSEGRAVRLVSGNAGGWAAVSGEWLVWTGAASGPTPRQQLYSAKLADLLAVAPPLVPPSPAPGELTLPAPLAGHTQRSPQGSDRYLVWQENMDTNLAQETALRGFDLRTQQTLSIATLPSDYIRYDLDGSLVVWDEPEAGCTAPCLAGEVRGEDLASGQTFAVATGPGQQSNPALSGRTVAWVDVRNNQAQLLLKDLAALTATVLTTTAYTASPYAYNYIGSIFISPQYVVWAVMSGWSAGSNPTNYAQLQAYDRQTGAIQDIAGYGGGPYDHGPRLSGYALEGEQLVWIAGGLHYANLRTGDRRDLFDETAPSAGTPIALQDFRAGTILWTVGAAVYGWRMDQPGAVRLVNLSSGGTQATLAGEWLVWDTCNETACGPLHAARLADLFAGARTP